MQYSFGIVLIDYNSAERTMKYIHDFFRFVDEPPKTIVIVDNYAEGNKTNIIVSHFHLNEITIDEGNSNYCFACFKTYTGVLNDTSIYLIKTGMNYGYAKGNNLGIRFLHNLNIDYALISNSDIVFKEKIHISTFCDVLENNLNIIGVGSDVFRIDGARQSPCRYLNIYDRWWRGKIFWPLTKCFFRNIDEAISPEEDCCVYRLIGAFFMVNIVSFQLVGGFDESTFLYGEELILSERAALHDMQFYYVKGLTVFHEDGMTTKKASEFSANKMKMQLSSDLYYYSNYRGVNILIILVTRFIVNSYLIKKRFVELFLKHIAD